jgi:hypothetical protein
VVRFTITGWVQRFVTVEPERIVLRGQPGEELKASVKIVPGEDFPFSILQAQAKHGRFISIALEDLKDSEQKGFLLTVVNLRKNPGRYFDVVSLKTDSAIRPELRVNVSGFIQNRSKKTRPTQ